jgi:Holliday junction resolvase-like predicted endonuclease
MRPSLALLKGKNLYKALQVGATSKVQVQKRLEKLHQTLAHFKVQKKNWDSIAEAILRFDFIHRNGPAEPDPTDRLAMAFWEIVKYYQELLKK